MKRAFAIWGHYFVANLIIGGCVFLVIVSLMIALGMNFGDTIREEMRKQPAGNGNEMSDEDMRALFEQVMKNGGNAQVQLDAR